MKPSFRFFSLDLARKALALVGPILSDLMETRSRWKGILEGLACPGDLPWGEAPGLPLKELSALYGKMEEYRRELEDLGVQVLDEEEGEVGFPARLEGCLVFLSWRLGEEDILGWRPWILSREEDLGPRYPLSSSPTCKAWVQEEWGDLPEIL